MPFDGDVRAWQAPEPRRSHHGYTAVLLALIIGCWGVAMTLIAALTSSYLDAESRWRLLGWGLTLMAVAALLARRQAIELYRAWSDIKRWRVF